MCVSDDYFILCFLVTAPCPTRAWSPTANLRHWHFCPCPPPCSLRCSHPPHPRCFCRRRFLLGWEVKMTLLSQRRKPSSVLMLLLNLWVVWSCTPSRTVRDGTIERRRRLARGSPSRYVPKQRYGIVVILRVVIVAVRVIVANNDDCWADQGSQYLS